MWVKCFSVAAICQETPGMLQDSGASSDPREVSVTVSNRWINFDSYF